MGARAAALLGVAAKGTGTPQEILGVPMVPLGKQTGWIVSEMEEGKKELLPDSCPLISLLKS